MTRSDVAKGHPEYYQDMAERIARRGRRLLRQPVRQPGQPARPRDHDRAGDLAADGRPARRRRVRRRLGRHHHRPQPLLRARRARTSRWCWPIRPARCWPTTCAPGSVGTAGSWLVEGIGEDFVPPICRSVARRARLHDQRRGEPAHRPRPAARAKASWPDRRRARWSPRRCATAASRPTPKRVVTFVCDSGNKYLSKMFNDYWMHDQGFLRGERCAATCAT